MARNVPALADAGALALPDDEKRALVRRILRSWERESPTNSPNTLDAKRRDLAAFGHFLGLTSSGAELRCEAAELLLFDGFSKAHERAREWLSWMAERVSDKGKRRPRRAPSTRARRLAHLRSLVRVAQEYGLPWGLQLKGPRTKRYRDARGPEAWKVYGVIAELVAAAPKDAHAARDALVLQLLFVMGLRRQSVVELDVSDVRDGAVWLYVKGDEDQRRKELPPSTRGALDAWLRHRGSFDGPLITGIRRNERRRGLSASAIYRLCVRHGLGNPHGLRHSGATKLAREGHSVFDLQAHLGQATPTSAQHYVDDVHDLEGKASAYLAQQLDELYDCRDERASTGTTDLPRADPR